MKKKTSICISQSSFGYDVHQSFTHLVNGVAGKLDLNRVPLGRLGLLTAFKPSADESECNLAKCLYLDRIGSVILMLNRPELEFRLR